MSDQRSSRDFPRPDLFEIWRQFYEANEQAWTKTIKDVTTTRVYAEAQGKMLETFLAFQKMMREGMTSQLANLNIPTRDDVARIGELVTQLEEKIDQLDDRLGGAGRHLGVLGQLERTLERLDKHLSEHTHHTHHDSTPQQKTEARGVTAAPVAGDGLAHATQGTASQAPRPRSRPGGQIGGAKKAGGRRTAAHLSGDQKKAL